MGGCVSTNTREEAGTLGNDQPSFQPAVLLNVCYWEEPSTVGSLEVNPQQVNYDSIIKEIQKVK